MKAYLPLTLALAVIILGACQKEHAEEVPMDFSASQTVAAEASTDARQNQSRTTAAGQATPATKAGWTTIGKDDLTKYSFGIFGGYSATEGGTLTNLFDSDKAVKVFHDGTNWKYNDVKYWRRNSHYRFRAYCPYKAEVLPSTSADNIYIEYRIIDHQYDLLVAFAHRCPATDSEGYETVNMAFQHALSGLRFQVVFDKSVPDGQTDQIISFHLKGLRSAGTLTYSHEAGEPLKPSLSWSTNNSFDSSYEYYKWTGSTEFGKDTAVNIFSDNNGVVFAIPQTIEKGKTSVHFTTANGAMDHTATLPPITWEPGKIYTYTLKVLKSSVEVNVGIKDWDEVQSSVEVYL